MKTISIVVLAALLTTPLLAADRTFSNGEPVNVQPDMGYVLVRTFQRRATLISGNFGYAPLLIRVASAEEIEHAKTAAKADPEHWQEKVESNVSEPSEEPYADVAGQQTLLMALRPGTYVLGGLARTKWGNPGIVAANLCMGTVKMEIKPGMVTDLGTIVNANDAEPTTIPELAKIVMGKDIGYQVFVDDVAIRPATPNTEIPQALRGLAIVPADYRAVAPFPNYLGAAPNRLAPLAGVLDYDKDGNVIDLKAAQ